MIAIQPDEWFPLIALAISIACLAFNISIYRRLCREERD